MDEQKVGEIKVTKLVDNPDGSANIEIETDREATRFLVEQGLIALLEKCIDKENEDYALSPELQALKSMDQRQLVDEIDEGFDALNEDGLKNDS